MPLNANESIFENSFKKIINHHSGNNLILEVDELTMYC